MQPNAKMLQNVFMDFLAKFLDVGYMGNNVFIFFLSCLITFVF